MPTIFGRGPLLSLLAAEKTLVPSGFYIGMASYFLGSRFYRRGISGVSQGQLVPNYTQGGIRVASRHSLQNKRRSWSSDITTFKGLTGSWTAEIVFFTKK
jgi:hypothetical protein